MEPPRLLDLAIKALVDNIDNLDKDLVKTIIVPFRQKMLKEMLEMARNHYLNCDRQDDHKDKLWPMLPFLINSKIYTKLDTLCLMVCPCYTVTNSRFQEFIRCLKVNTPNLRKLRIHRPTQNGEYSLEERELNSIMQLKNLTILEIRSVRVPLSRISDISRRCEKLKRLEANDVTIDVELSSATFGDDFAYFYIRAFEFYRGRMSLIMQRKMLTRNPIFKDDKHFVHLSLRPRNNQEILHLAQLFPEKLNEIWLDSSQMENIDEFPHLPHLKKAIIICNSKSVHVLRCFMKRNGESLQELSLCDVDIKDKIAFSDIFNCCPNLQSLSLHCCTLSANDAPFDAMQQLKQFSWCSMNKESCDKVAFSSILSAPLLEDVRISVPKIDFSDNATIIARIQKREILQNIKQIRMFRTMNLIAEDEDASYLTSFTELENAFASVISAGPL
ncbi:Hypothetical predicted protein [Cloeon dipterum]|uniref:F-box domain-containing protein n=1 Tax=Cloeon dipterum TaxID=197152 RepID=A0A8S1DSK1_9INSE|nr:Hypothetical predicted protein [Cloeon dipterum]